MQQFISGRQGGIVMPKTAPVAADGTFVFRDLTPAEFWLSVGAPPGKDGTTESINIRLTLSSDLDGLVLVTGTGGSLAGRVIVEGGEPSAVQPEELLVVASPEESEGTPTFIPRRGNGQVRDDLTFERTGLAGRQRISMRLPEGWMLSSVQVSGREYIDEGIDFKHGERIAGAELRITNQAGSVAGRVTDDRSDTALDATVVVFPADSRLWTAPSRYVGMARPDHNGQYRVTNLPPGEYLAVAVDTIETGEWLYPEFLESVRPAATKVELVPGTTKSLDIGVTRRQ
jgi:hypothetical protein